VAVITPVLLSQWDPPLCLLRGCGYLLTVLKAFMRTGSTRLMVVNSRTVSVVDLLSARTPMQIGFPVIGKAGAVTGTGFLDTGALALKIVRSPTVDATAD